MKLKKLIIYVAGGLLTIAAIGAVTAPRLTAAIRGAFVEVIIPSHPFASSTMVNTSIFSTGPDTGILGITSISLTSFDAIPDTVLIWAPTVSGSGCGTAVDIPTRLSDTPFGFYVKVPAGQTIHLHYPSPLTFPGVGGHSCVAASVIGTGDPRIGVQMVLNGFVN